MCIATFLKIEGELNRGNIFTLNGEISPTKFRHSIRRIGITTRGFTLTSKRILPNLLITAVGRQENVVSLSTKCVVITIVQHQ